MLYVYMPILEDELRRYKLDFNNHRTRKQRGQYRPHGIVNDMYRLPTEYGKISIFVLKKENVFFH